MHFEGQAIVIDGKSKKWSELTPAERTEVRRSIAEAHEELARHRIDRAEIDREIREALADKEDVRRDLAEARAEVARAMSEIDTHAVEIRRSGQDPEQLKATIRASLRSVENIDVEAIKRQALASIDTAQIEASVAAAEASIRASEEQLDRIESLDHDD
jgi:chromosome segregation ATPase